MQMAAPRRLFMLLEQSVDGFERGRRLFRVLDLSPLRQAVEDYFFRRGQMDNMQTGARCRREVCVWLTVRLEKVRGVDDDAVAVQQQAVRYGLDGAEQALALALVVLRCSEKQTSQGVTLEDYGVNQGRQTAGEGRLAGPGQAYEENEAPLPRCRAPLSVHGEGL
jgi:hypothetical protein